VATRIIEFGGHGLQGVFPIVPASQRVLEQTAMTATSTSAQSSAFDKATGLVCVQSDEQIYVLVAANPTATTNSYRIAAGGEQWFDCLPGAGWKAAIRT
jgi:hypothetical protein